MPRTPGFSAPDPRRDARLDAITVILGLLVAIGIILWAAQPWN